MSTADEINLKTRAAWPVVDSLREKFAQALNDEMKRLMVSWPFGKYFSSGGKIQPLARRRGPRGRRLALKARRKGWLPRVFGVDWGSPGGDVSALVVRRGREILFAAPVDKTIFEV